jgi:adenosylhomocysteine nucleosidase
MPPNALAEPLGIVVAMSLEARSLLPKASSRSGPERVRRDRLAISGQGAERAAAATERLVAKGAKQLLNVGVAGGLVAGLRPGDLLVPEAVVDVGEPLDRLLPDGKLRRRLISTLRARMSVHGGVLATSPQPVLSTEDKRTLSARVGAAAVDMEAAAIARVAVQAGVPFAVIKSICDPQERCLPVALLALVQASGRLSVRGLLGVLARGPSAWRALAAPARDYAAARRTLAAAAPLVFLATLGEP